MTEVEALLAHLRKTCPVFAWEPIGADGIRAARVPWGCWDAATQRLTGSMAISVRKSCIVVCAREGSQDIVERGDDARVCVARALARCVPWMEQDVKEVR